MNEPVFNTNYFKAIICIGADGGDKSILIKRMVECNQLHLLNEDDYIFTIQAIKFIINFDVCHYMNNGVFPFIPEKYKTAKRELLAIVEKLKIDESMQWLNYRAGLIINLKGFDYEAVEELDSCLRGYGYDVEIFFFNTPLENDLRRNSLSEKPFDESRIKRRYYQRQSNILYLQEEFDTRFNIIRNEIYKDEHRISNNLQRLCVNAYLFLDAPIKNERGQLYISALKKEGKEKLFDLFNENSDLI